MFSLHHHPLPQRTTHSSPSPLVTSIILPAPPPLPSSSAPHPFSADYQILGYSGAFARLRQCAANSPQSPDGIWKRHVLMRTGLCACLRGRSILIRLSRFLPHQEKSANDTNSFSLSSFGLADSIGLPTSPAFRPFLSPGSGPLGSWFFPLLTLHTPSFISHR